MSASKIWSIADLDWNISDSCACGTQTRLNLPVYIDTPGMFFVIAIFLNQERKTPRSIWKRCWTSSH